VSDIHSQYPVSVRWEGERRGLGSSPDGLPDLPVAVPPAFGGTAGVWSPEHLFVLSVATCWLTTFLAVAQASKLEFAAVDCEGNGALEKGEDRRFWIARIVLRPRVTVVREEDRERALRLIEKAEAACLIRNSIRTDVTLESEVLLNASATPDHA
jgi:peroxiredoxin-like protein